jgi:hypothetical protein
MNPSSEDGPKSNQETQAFDPLLTDEEKVDQKEGARKDEPAQAEEDKERAEMITKEAMLRVTGGQL